MDVTNYKLTSNPENATCSKSLFLPFFNFSSSYGPGTKISPSCPPWARDKFFSFLFENFRLFCVDLILNEVMLGGQARWTSYVAYPSENKTAISTILRLSEFRPQLAGYHYQFNLHIVIHIQLFIMYYGLKTLTFTIINSCQILKRQLAQNRHFFLF